MDALYIYIIEDRGFRPARPLLEDYKNNANGRQTYQSDLTLWMTALTQCDNGVMFFRAWLHAVSHQHRIPQLNLVLGRMGGSDTRRISKGDVGLYVWSRPTCIEPNTRAGSVRTG
jgi:hypothetical protein